MCDSTLNFFVVETTNRLPTVWRWRLHVCGSLCSSCVYLFTDVSDSLLSDLQWSSPQKR
jgi:hypothetical protein